MLKNIINKIKWVRMGRGLKHRRMKRPARRIGTTSYKHYMEHKERARELVLTRLEFYNKIYGFSYNKIFIKNQRSRWGSCSSNKNLNFNYKIILLSQEQQDYVIIHELCHLQEFNHGGNFWALVEKTIPNHESIKHSLRNFKLVIS